MLAKEMFEALGYVKIIDNDNFLIYSKTIELMKEQFRFNKFNRYMNKVAVMGSSMKIEDYLDIWYDEIKAINQQCKELGWLDE